MVKLSIIVPVFNIERYLEDCLESILNQTFSDFELILVDDGSKDKSGLICDNYALKDNRIIVFHNSNNGVSFSRNFGIENAKGEWITFIDSDDWVDQDYISNMFSGGSNFDLYCTGHQMQAENGKWIIYTPKKSIYIKDDLISFYNDHLSSGIIRGPWCKLLKRSTIIDHNIRFDLRLSFGEDTIFTLDYLKFVNNIFVSDLPQYHRRWTPGSLAKKVNLIGWNNFVDAYKPYVLEIIKDKNNGVENIKKDYADRILTVLMLTIKDEIAGRKISKQDAAQILEKPFKRIKNFSYTYSNLVRGRQEKYIVNCMENAENEFLFSKKLGLYFYLKRSKTIFNLRKKEFEYYWINNLILPFPSRLLRKTILKKKLGAVGVDSNFLRFVEIRDPFRIFIGNNCVINQHVLLDGRGGNLIIGNNVDIAQDSVIWTLGHDPNDDYHRAIGADVTIGDYAWIGHRVIIMPGVTIGKGSVIGANSVVTKSIPPMSIAAGSPAKVIGTRKSGLKYQLNYKPWLR